MKRRYLQENIHADLQEKMVFLSGPRQVGKTTVAKTFLYQISLEGKEDVLDGMVRVMPATKFLAGLP
jgi:predicted AAA+ superfamily ATPase